MISEKISTLSFGDIFFPITLPKDSEEVIEAITITENLKASRLTINNLESKNIKGTSIDAPSLITSLLTATSLEGASQTVKNIFSGGTSNQTLISEGDTTKTASWKTATLSLSYQDRAVAYSPTSYVVSNIPYTLRSNLSTKSLGTTEGNSSYGTYTAILLYGNTELRTRSGGQISVYEANTSIDGELFAILPQTSGSIELMGGILQLVKNTATSLSDDQYYDMIGIMFSNTTYSNTPDFDLQLMPICFPNQESSYALYNDIDLSYK